MQKNSNRRPLNEDGSSPACLCCSAPALKHADRNRWKDTCSTTCAKQLITQKMTATKNSPEWAIVGTASAHKAIATQRNIILDGYSKAELTANKIKAANNRLDLNGLTGYQRASRKASIGVRVSNEASGHWKPVADKVPFDQYRVAVSVAQRRFNSYIRQLENYDKRAPSGTPGGYHIDHRISVWFGFRNGIPPEIIGHVCNLQMKTWLDNNRKWSKCDLEIDDLLEAIEIFNQPQTLPLTAKRLT